MTTDNANLATPTDELAALRAKVALMEAEQAAKDREIAALKAAKEGGRAEYTDPLLPGFWARVTDPAKPGNAKDTTCGQLTVYYGRRPLFTIHPAVAEKVGPGIERAIAWYLASEASDPRIAKCRADKAAEKAARKTK